MNSKFVYPIIDSWVFIKYNISYKSYLMNWEGEHAYKKRKICLDGYSW
mgnify:CR=1 FL=1|jgi:hypothetical protein